MADKNPLTPEEVTELFSEIDASGVLDPTLAKKRTERMREKEAAVKRGDKAALAQLREKGRLVFLSMDAQRGPREPGKTYRPAVRGRSFGLAGEPYHYEDRDGRSHWYFGADRGHADRLRRDAPLEHCQPVRERFGGYRFHGTEGRP